MKGAIYTRYSTSKQTKNSTAYQVEVCTRFCAESNIEVVGVYSDEETTGVNTGRQQFNNVLQLAYSKAIECIVIYDITRNNRDVVDWFTFRKEMKALNITVMSPNDRIGDIYNPADFLQELIAVGIGHHSILTTRQKSYDGRISKARTAAFLGGVPPLGYDIERQQYVVNPKEARAVERMFTHYANGKSYNYILKELESLNIIGKRGKPLGKNSLHSILKNKRYIGQYTWLENKYKEMHRNLKKNTKNKDVVTIENAIPQIIEKELFYKVQERMKNNSRRTSNSKRRAYLLTGLIECAKCGSKYIGRTTTNSKGNTSSCYTCDSRYRTQSCGAENLNLEYTESDVRQAVREWAAKLDIADFASKLAKHNEVYKKDDSKERAEYLQLEQVIFNVTTAIKKGVYYDEMMSEVTAAKARMKELEKELCVADTANQISEMAMQNILEEIKADIEDVSDVGIDNLIKKYVRKIIAHQDRIEILMGVTMNGSGGRI